MSQETSWKSSEDSPQKVPTWVARRRYLIDPKRQLRTTVMTTSLIAALLLVINLGFALLRTSQSSFLSAAAPQLTPVLEKQNTTFSVIMAVISIGLVVAVSLKTIVETHRTAGAVFAVRQRLDRVMAGDVQVALKLRRGDNLQDLENPFNAMVSSLRNRALEEAKVLENLALQAKELGSGGKEIAGVLEEMSRQKRLA